MTAPQSIVQLVDKFKQGAGRYNKPDYNETEVRVEFVNPLFEALGWDVRNSTQVKHEDTVVVEDDDGKKKPKKPDYGFRLNGVLQFFVETKKPAVNLRDNPIPAFQVRRYGWSGKLPMSILTDFEEFIVYDCGVKPDRKDPSSTARLEYYKFTDYVDKWDEIYGLFSKEAAESGALATWLGKEQKRGAESVDVAFLNEMEKWREMLAQDIHLHNRDLTPRQLNHLVQRTIDRIVFLRITEDRNIEQYGRLRGLIENTQDIYDLLKGVFVEADDKYNSGLFHFNPKDTERGEADKVAMDSTISDDPLRKIISSLYFPASPYEFSVLPADILGQVYERFLGKVINLSDSSKVTVEEKPEVRKAGGVYYTPTYIVDYIVANTVGKLVEGKTPEQVEKLTVLDPACGSGSFLIGAYQFLMDWHLDYYQENPKKKYNDRVQVIADDPAGGMMLTIKEKKRILTANIYGVDLDQSAVEVSKLSLLLKMMEVPITEDNTQFRMFGGGHHILPNLGDNIKWGNSLIGSDFYSGKQMGMFDDEQMYKVKAFDWDSDKRGFGEIMAKGGFDAVIGNPPYVRPHKIEPEHKEYFWKMYSGFVKKSDLYCCFIEKSIDILSISGYFGMIVSNSWLRLDSFEEIRKIILYKTNIDCIIDFTNNVFDDAAVKTNILLLSKPNIKDNKIKKSVTPASIDLNSLELKTLNQSLFESTYKNIFDLSIQEENENIKVRMRSLGQELGGLFSLSFGLKTGDDSKFLTYELGEDVKDYKKLLRGENISRYEYEHVGEYVWYVPQAMKKHRRTARPGNKARFEQPKVLVRDTGEGLRCTFEQENHYVKDVLVVSDDKKNAKLLKYLAGLLNSRLLRFYYETSFPTLHVQRNELASLPIRTIDFDNPADVAQHDKMVSLVETMLDLHKQVAGLSGVQREVVEQQIEATDKQIDRLVYGLYGLTDDEIKIVEG